MELVWTVAVCGVVIALPLYACAYLLFLYYRWWLKVFQDGAVGREVIAQLINKQRRAEQVKRGRDHV